MELCNVCDAGNGNAFQKGSGCHICAGKAEGTAKMIDEAAALMSKEDISSFSISTMIPKDWLKNEEDVWDIRMGEARSIKDWLNKSISASLEKKTGLPYRNDGDCRVVFDYESGKVNIERNEIFIFGRYMKLASGLSQSRWRCARCDGKGCPHCKEKGKMYESVEERIGEPFKKALIADEYTMHASGREDVDATNTAGRAFVFEIKNPKKRKIDLGAVANEIAGGVGKGKEVEVVDLAYVSRTFVELVTESHFDKEYEADVEFGREIDEKDGEKMRSIAGKTLLQQTPTRVAHRRADLVRSRKVKEFEIIGMEGKTARLRIKAEAGTYIKELISGDQGRTKPSIAEILGTSAVCKKLVVTEIDDGFLDFVMRTGR